jgi:hypothetical protein
MKRSTPSEAHALEGVVELREQRRQPRAALLGHHELQLREALEHARQQQEQERPARVVRDLGQHDQRRRRVHRIAGRPRAAVAVHRHLEVLADTPQPVVVGMVERLDPVDVRRHRRQQDAAAQAVLGGPRDVFDRVVDVVQEDLADAGAPLGVA